MGVISEIAAYLIRTIGGIVFWAVLLRFLLQLARADFYNPLSQTLVRFTNPLLKPLRRLIPGFFGIDIAALVLALAIKFITIELLLLVLQGGQFPIWQVLLWAVLACLVTVFNIYFLALVGTIILSWVAMGSRHPIVVLIQQIGEPVLAPFRRLLPPMGGIDFSPMLAFVIFYVVKILLANGAQMLGLPVRDTMGLLMLGI